MAVSTEACYVILHTANIPLSAYITDLADTDGPVHKYDNIYSQFVKDFKLCLFLSPVRWRCPI